VFRPFFLSARWLPWSLAGTLLILATTGYKVELDVRINEWFGSFYDLIQEALSKPGSLDADAYYGQLATFGQVAGIYMLVSVALEFFTKHYVFRWRTAMNDFYVGHWSTVRRIEGASQRVQEDTMRFARLMEDLGVNFMQSVLTLLAFLPILWGLSEGITRLPLIGEVPRSLVWVALVWAAMGTVVLGLIGFKLPGLAFDNQRREAAYRKELVYGEDHAERAEPETLAELFLQMRRNYFRLFFHYLDFDVAKWSYLQFSVLVPYVALGPTLVAGGLTLGVMQQVVRAFGKVQELVPVPGEQLEHDRRADLGLQAAAGVRGADPRHLIQLTQYREQDESKLSATPGIAWAGAIMTHRMVERALTSARDARELPPQPWRWRAVDAARALRERRLSSVELTQSVLARLDEVNPRVNAVVAVQRDEALRSASRADRAIAAARSSDASGASSPSGASAWASLPPLLGIPVTTKLNVDQRGLPTSNGVVAFADVIAAEDSPPVAHLRDAGAVLFGRTNVPAFSMRWHTENALHGRTLNPFDPQRTPGGSSGGAAAALAVGIGAIAQGNDGGGSIRYPGLALRRGGHSTDDGPGARLQWHGAGRATAVDAADLGAGAAGPQYRRPAHCAGLHGAGRCARSVVDAGAAGRSGARRAVAGRAVDRSGR
jgi:peptide/bleomycin uptake transporter